VGVELNDLAVLGHGAIPFWQSRCRRAFWGPVDRKLCVAIFRWVCRCRNVRSKLGGAGGRRLVNGYFTKCPISWGASSPGSMPPVGLRRPRVGAFILTA
jgi:hypothetical protein